MNQKIILAGGSGFLGNAAATFFKTKGYDVVILSRSIPLTWNGIKYIQWDGVNLGDWVQELENSVAVINFTGKSVNCIYNEKNKKEIIESRINSVKALDQAILQLKTPPNVLIQSASLAIFGDNQNPCYEDSSIGEGFSVDVCTRWESEFSQITLPNTRKVILRIGFVLGKNGGALEPLTKLAKWFLGGTIGSGTQFISWIHIDDMNEMFKYCIENQVTGTFNATGPTPVENRIFMKELRRAVHRPWSPPAPTLFVKMGAYLIMRADSSLALTGRNCLPKRFLDSGFKFKFDNLGNALANLI
jgi:uncharacterized protein (TIGR01777 family)